MILFALKNLWTKCCASNIHQILSELFQICANQKLDWWCILSRPIVSLTCYSWQYPLKFAMLQLLLFAIPKWRFEDGSSELIKTQFPKRDVSYELEQPPRDRESVREEVHRRERPRMLFHHPLHHLELSKYLNKTNNEWSMHQNRSV